MCITEEEFALIYLKELPELRNSELEEGEMLN